VGNISRSLDFYGFSAAKIMQLQVVAVIQDNKHRGSDSQRLHAAFQGSTEETNS
jgi:hypothetical protein